MFKKFKHWRYLNTKKKEKIQCQQQHPSLLPVRRERHVYNIHHLPHDEFPEDVVESDRIYLGERLGVCILYRETRTRWEPHFHLESTKIEFSTVVRLDISDYMDHGYPIGILEKDEALLLYDWMKSLDPAASGLYGITHWKGLVILWNSNIYLNGVIRNTDKMPDYRKLGKENI